VFDLVKRAHVLTLVAVVAASSAIGATQDDELAVDPTVPLSVAFSDSDAATISNADADGSIFDIFTLDAFTTYELSSVLIRAEDRIAVINNERVRVGDKIGSAVVATIEADHVTLRVDGETQLLELYENSIKTLVKGDE
jgi:hypothetical protein